MAFKFNLGDSVEISASGEIGSVIGRADYTADENRYFLRYKAADGTASESWWAEGALEVAAFPA
ncbi:hypothetical protein [Burkholderia gladioli]|uniref:hypothetical protein n=1 Tax=Burkholderia gladioli TaxID=28095 RepID=UPI00163F9587|nr:hypothetical protein [Burkholderia gladioli]